jgi:NAD(P)-dependent dehydrogenase (short-subunit alcohol dehydrogenase family)
MRLQGKLALVTGGSEGIGLAIAEALAREGAELCIVGRNLDKLTRGREQLGASVKLAVPADLATESGVNEVVEGIGRAGKALDILINNAAIAHVVPFENVSRDQYEAALALNLAAPFFLTQKLLPHLAQPGASIINISSYFANKMVMGRAMSVYSLSKGALNSLTKALAFELGPLGIRVNAVAPGSVDTPMRRKSIEVMSSERQVELQRYVERSYPLGRIGQPSDLGGIVVFLASQEAAWATGGIFAIDGGFTAG